MSSETMQRFQAAAETIRQRVGEAEIGVILGSGLGDYVDALQDAKYIDYKDIPGFPVSTAPGHAGRWWTGTLHGQRVCMMQGRFHYYEGYDLQDVTMPVRVMALLGVKTLVVTNAAGGVNLNFAQGCLMMLTDFINMSGHNPLTGRNLAEFGTRFPDMTHAYDVQLMEKCRQAAKALGIPLQEGVYMWMNGPTYETPAEIRMARILGADAVGMSTVPETIVARHCGIRVLGVSCITNMAAGIIDQAMRRIALISGGSSGIGEACVRLFAKDGWAVVFLCRTHPERAQAITDELRGKGLDVAFRTCDIADSEQVNDTVAAILKDYKHIDALVNCAGIAYRGLLTDMPDATWHHLLATDLDSVFYLQRAVLPGMISRGHGAIVNVSSMWGEVGASCEAAYSAAKAGVIGLTKATAKEVGPSGIRVNCVTPGVIRTPMNAELSDEDLAALADETPLGRIGEPEECAEAILFLASEKASFITGQVLGVSGGLII